MTTAMTEVTMPRDEHAPSSGARRWLLLSGSAAAAVLACCAIGVLPTWSLGGRAATLGMGIAAGVVLLAAAVGAVPVAAAAASPMRTVANAVLGGIAVRFVLMLALALAVALCIAGQTRTAFLLWVGIHYIFCLAATAGVELWLLGRRRER